MDLVYRFRAIIAGAAFVAPYYALLLVWPG